MAPARLNQLMIGIKGAGEMASAIAWRLYRANIQKIFMMEIPHPLAVRRSVSFCEAVYEGMQTVEEVAAKSVEGIEAVLESWDKGQIAVIVDPQWTIGRQIRPNVMVDAIVSKKNLGTTRTEAPLVIGLGPGLVAGKDVHMVIETKRGHNLGRIIASGCAEADTGIPGSIGGYTTERVLRAPNDGLFRAERDIGDAVRSGDVVGAVNGTKVRAKIAGIIRGLIRSDIRVSKNLKLGDIDPRGDSSYCYTISDKARAIAGSVLEAILRVYNV